MFIWLQVLLAQFQTWWSRLNEQERISFIALSIMTMLLAIPTVMMMHAVYLISGPEALTRLLTVFVLSLIAGVYYICRSR